jgi:hypothetical protein
MPRRSVSASSVRYEKLADGTPLVVGSGLADRIAASQASMAAIESSSGARSRTRAKRSKVSLVLKIPETVVFGEKTWVTRKPVPKRPVVSSDSNSLLEPPERSAANSFRRKERAVVLEDELAAILTQVYLDTIATRARPGIECVLQKLKGPPDSGIVAAAPGVVDLRPDVPRLVADELIVPSLTVGGQGLVAHLGLASAWILWWPPAISMLPWSGVRFARQPLKVRCRMTL